MQIDKINYSTLKAWEESMAKFKKKYTEIVLTDKVQEEVVDTSKVKREISAEEFAKLLGAEPVKYEDLDPRSKCIVRKPF